MSQKTTTVPMLRWEGRGERRGERRRGPVEGSAAKRWDEKNESERKRTKKRKEKKKKREICMSGEMMFGLIHSRPNEIAAQGPGQLQHQD